MTLEVSEPPVACLLNAGDYKSRSAWIAAFNAASLQGVVREDLRLELTYAASARDEVLQFVRQEQECCAFLAFTVHDTPDQLLVVIEAPERGREAADTIFDTFQAKPTDVVTGCDCRGGANA